jgi:mannan endo-1,4-beta-mannosidase
MRRFFSLLFIIALFSACNPDTPPGVPELSAPVLVSSVPENHAENLPAGDWTVTLVFDQNIFAPTAGHSRISINNGAKIKSVSANLKELKINISELKKSTSYTLVVPKGVVAGPTKVEVEEIKITFSTVEDRPVSESLCTPNPSSEAVFLYNYLRENYGKKAISGAVAQVDWDTVEADRVDRWTGKHPKINVFDYIFHYASPANWIDYGDISVVENWYNAGGIVGAMWHWNVPKSETATETDVTFRPKNDSFPDGTTFSPANALTEGTWENIRMKNDLKKVADYLLLLKNKNIPVLWRPLHEAAGNIYAAGYKGSAWFWWGSDGAEAFKGLWIYMFDYFQQRGLNNLIWIWTTEVNDPPFYPGDDYVDIIGRDLYNNTDAAAIAVQFEQIQTQYPNKMITLSECGNVSNISAQWAAGAHWLWFMPWYDYDAVDNDNPPHDHAGKQWWADAMNQQFVITR